MKDLDIIDSLKEAVEICEDALKSVQRQRFWYTLSTCMLIIPLIWIIWLNCMNISLAADIGLNIVCIFLTALLCYTVFMSSLWNCAEKNALRAGRLAIEIYMTCLDNNKS